MMWWLCIQMPNLFEYMKKKIFNFFRSIPKRKRFVIALVAIVVPTVSLTLLPFSTMLFFIPFLAAFVYGATYLALLEDVSHIEWVVLFIPPIYFCIFFLLFYYLLPVRWLTRIPFMVILSVALYAIFLSENIFNVGVEKSLPLYRAAYSVSNFIMLLAFLFLFTVLYSLRQHYLVNMFFGGLLAWPLFFHAIWTASPKSVLEERVYKFSTISTILLSFAILILNFIPIKTSIYALYTVAVAYMLTGVTQEIVQNTAFREHIRAYIIMVGAMTILILLTAQWS